MKHGWKIMLIVWFPFVVGLSQSISCSEYLDKVKTHLVLPTMEYPTFRAPWLDEIQLRTETREFSFDRQRYALRLEPQPLGLGKLQTKLGSISAQEIKLERQKYYARLLKDYLKQWTTAAIYQEIGAEMQHLKLLLEDKKLICQRLAQKSLNDLDNYLKVQNDLYDLERDYQALIAKQSAIRNQWSGLFGWPTDVPLSTALLTIDKIQQFVHQNENLWTKAVMRREQSLALKELNLDYELAAEKAEKNKIVDFVQFRYRGPSVNPWQEKMSIGLGLNLPVMGNHKFDIYKLNLEKQSLHDEHREAVMELSRDFITLKQKITLSVNAYNLLTSQKAEINALMEYFKKQPIEELSPLLIIEQNREWHKYGIRQWEQVLVVYEHYLNLLDLCGYFFPDLGYNYIETLPSD